MVTIHETELKEKILLGITKAGELNRPILVSEVNKVEPTEPLAFFNNGNEAFFGERFYWKNPEGSLNIAGVGIAAQLSSEQAEGRFSKIDRKWKQLIQDSIVSTPHHAPGIGPLMFGGFSFDPLKEKTALWSKYPEALFHVPRFMLTMVDGDVYVTTNVLCTKHDDVSLFYKVVAERDSLLKEDEHLAVGKTAPLKGMTEIKPAEWKKSVTEAIRQLNMEGLLKKVVLARELRLFFDKKVETGTLLQNLESEQKTSFIFSFESGGDSFIGASPERLVQKHGKSVQSACLAGSFPRGKTDTEDRQLSSQLLNDEKNLAEHQYVVDMIRNALEGACEQVKIPDKPSLMKIRDIQHLFTPVEGVALDTTSLLDLVERLHPTPALGGLPKQLAVETIRELEELDRGFYAAPIGWMDYAGNGEFAVAIRSGLIQGQEASLFAGCGVVANSDVESEYVETRLKFRPMLSALGGTIE
ncbi:isochorismate synthase [Neobacillus notoginsengisoli]|uniref:Isochorismate synthase MenF n=1 Tax=Neobacillus notoginsengisoli TaxID=1578198 RepID=A0A417YDQ0_9BACI|nr:isochorismate synthase [Neobacillus notoginsengisoli]RHW30741.1 isochorismate synthase [Neobacillus notoginsengisoli]